MVSEQYKAKHSEAKELLASIQDLLLRHSFNTSTHTPADEMWARENDIEVAVQNLRLVKHVLRER